MSSIFVITDELLLVEQLLYKYQLHQQVAVKPLNTVNEPPSGHQQLILSGGQLQIPPNWQLQRTPILFPNSIGFAEEKLLGVLFFLLGDEQQGLDFLEEHPRLTEALLAASALQNNMNITADFQQEDAAFQWHNAAVLAHYGCLVGRSTWQSALKYYDKAWQMAVSAEEKAFTLYNWVTLLNDLGYLEEAIRRLKEMPEQGLSLEAKLSLKSIACITKLSSVSSGNMDLLPTLKDELGEVLRLCQHSGDILKEALMLIEASRVAELQGNFTEALGCAQRAYGHFGKLELPEMAANAQFRRAEVLMAWAQSGNPTMFAKAAESYREAVKVFTKETDPETFALIHHRLAVIYTEMPFPTEKRPMIAALSVTSFGEALAFYNKEDFPYEYAAICHNYGNAHLKYPVSLHTDNYRKALSYYQEALAIRTREQYPMERSLTTLNYLEACWLLPQEKLSLGLLEEMQAMAQEVRELVKENSLLKEAERHLLQLAELKKAMENA